MPEPARRPDYPVNLRVDGRPCLVVGGGTVATRKAEGLVASGAVVTVVAPEVVDEIGALPVARIERRPYRASDLDGQWLVVTCTDAPEVNAQVAADAEARGLWANSADDPANCSFTLPSVVRRGDLQVAVSTAGRSPALAAWLRRRLEAEIGPEHEVLLDLLAEARDQIRAEGRSSEGLDWNTALESGMLEAIRDGRIDEAREALHRCLSS